MGCIDRDKVVLVGRHALRAVRLADGKPGWDGRLVNLPNDGTPSGLGVLSGDGQYFVPLSSNEVVAVDIAAGKIAKLSESRRGGLPGNLICHQGKLISEGVEGVDCYPLADAAKAEVQRRSGRKSQRCPGAGPCGAKSCWTPANDRRPSPASAAHISCTRSNALATCCAMRCWTDCGRSLHLIAAAARKFERLLDNASERTAFLRLKADGLRRAGELAAALECYRNLLDLQPDPQPLDQVDKTLLVRRDRWVESRLADLREAAGAEWLAKIDELAVIATRASGPRSLRRPRRLRRNPSKPAPAEHNADWPVGQVEIATAPTTRDRNASSVSTVEMLGNPPPCFRNLSIKYDRSRGFIAYDGQGQELWDFSMAGYNFPNANRCPPRFARSLACDDGELLLFSMGLKLVAMDARAASPDVAPRMLWMKDMADPNADSADRPLPRVEIELPWQFQLQAGKEDRLHVFGPLASHYVCFRRLDNLVAADPRDGKTLWIRRDLPQRCVVFGDDRYVFVLQPHRDEAMLLRASNGELMGMRQNAANSRPTSQ